MVNTNIQRSLIQFTQISNGSAAQYFITNLTFDVLYCIVPSVGHTLQRENI